MFECHADRISYATVFNTRAEDWNSMPLPIRWGILLRLRSFFHSLTRLLYPYFFPREDSTIPWCMCVSMRAFTHLFTCFKLNVFAVLPPFCMSLHGENDFPPSFAFVFSSFAIGLWCNRRQRFSRSRIKKEELLPDVVNRHASMQHLVHLLILLIPPRVLPFTAGKTGSRLFSRHEKRMKDLENLHFSPSYPR